VFDCVLGDLELERDIEVGSAAKSRLRGMRNGDQSSMKYPVSRCPALRDSVINQTLSSTFSKRSVIRLWVSSANSRFMDALIGAYRPGRVIDLKYQSTQTRSCNAKTTALTPFPRIFRACRQASCIPTERSLPCRIFVGCGLFPSASASVARRSRPRCSLLRPTTRTNPISKRAG
jgi:hypothetical protein